MRIECDKVLTIDDFDELYSTWHGRTLTVMGEYIKVSQAGIPSRYFVREHRNYDWLQVC